jgi:hypothetical protein
VNCLQTVSGGQIELKPNHNYSLGRARDCDIVVEDIASSRYHARIRVSAKGRNVVVEDLDSRNGTFVDDERIEGRTSIRRGSRIRIGASVYMLNSASEGHTKEIPLCNLDTGTVGLDRLSLGPNVAEDLLRVIGIRGQTGSEFAGQLGAISLMEILQLLIQTLRSGTLHVAVEDGHATIDLRDGEVRTASFGDLDGFDALLALVRKKTGLFWLIEKFTPCTNLIQIPGSALLLELCRALDEQDRATGECETKGAEPG